MAVTYDQLRAAGLSTELAAMVIELARLAHKEPRAGKDGKGIAASAFDETTGLLTLTLTDGTVVVTADLRGRDLSSEVAALMAEIAAARGSHATLAARHQTIEAMASPNVGGVIPGRYYDNAFTATASSNAVGGNNRVEMAPFMTARPLSVDRIGVSVATGVAGALGRCFIYDTGADGWPDQLLWEAADDLDQSAAAFVEHVLTAPITLMPGMIYWLGHRHSVGASTLRGVPIGSAMSLGPVSAASNQYASMLRRTITFATPLPAQWAFTEADLVGNSAPPSIRMRAV